MRRDEAVADSHAIDRKQHVTNANARRCSAEAGRDAHDYNAAWETVEVPEGESRRPAQPVEPPRRDDYRRAARVMPEEDAATSRALGSPSGNHAGARLVARRP